MKYASFLQTTLQVRENVDTTQRCHTIYSLFCDVTGSFLSLVIKHIYLVFWGFLLMMILCRNPRGTINHNPRAT